MPRHPSLLCRRPGTVRLLATLTLAVLLAGCGRLGLGGDATATPEPVAQGTPRPTVDTAVRRVVTADGALVLPIPPQTLAFPASGTVLEVAVEPGDRVTAGQLLARLDLLPLDRA
ncbi:MAG: biotin/lipoyl-binding protein, partial [Anaerolineae bacterium]